MLSPRLTNCPECANIPSLLKKIDCKLAELGNSLYNNISYMLNQSIPAGDMLQLIAYRRILTYKYCNPDYVHEYSVAMIASRVIRITAGCVSRCNTPEPCLEIPCNVDVVANPTTTTTSTLPMGCKSFILYNTATIPESFLISNCDTGEIETLVLQGLCNICFQTQKPLIVSSNIVVIPVDACPTTSTTTTVEPTTTTTSSSSTSTTTSTSSSTTTSSSSSTTTTTTTICGICSPQDVTIGIQVWDVCNLNVSTYRNGDPIPEVTDQATWEALTTGAWCYYNNDPANAEYGKLYNWYAVNDIRGLAPVGYHVPSDEEWSGLTTFLGGQAIAGEKLKQPGFCHWLTPNYAANNSSGFTAFGGGYRYATIGFFNLKEYGEFWSTTEYDIDPTARAWTRTLFYTSADIYRSEIYKYQGMSVRCIKD